MHVCGYYINPWLALVDLLLPHIMLNSAADYTAFLMQKMYIKHHLLNLVGDAYYFSFSVDFFMWGNLIGFGISSWLFR